MTTKRFLDLNFLSQAPYGVYAVDMNRIITFWNRGAERILGHRAGDVIGLRCCRVLQRPPDNGTTPVCEDGCPAFYYARESRFPPVVHVRARCASGRRKPITITPLVVSQPHCDRTLLVNLFHERTEDAQGETTAGYVHESMDTGTPSAHPWDPAHREVIPFHIAEAVKCAGRLRVECSIQSQAVSDRTRPGSDSSSPRYASTASIFSSMLPYVLPSTHLRTSWKTRSAGFNSGLYGGWMMVASPTLRTISPR